MSNTQQLTWQPSMNIKIELKIIIRMRLMSKTHIKFRTILMVVLYAVSKVMTHTIQLDAYHNSTQSLTQAKSNISVHHSSMKIRKCKFEFRVELAIIQGAVLKVLTCRTQLATNT